MQLRIHSFDGLFWAKLFLWMDRSIVRLLEGVDRMHRVLVGIGRQWYWAMVFGSLFSLGAATGLKADDGQAGKQKTAAAAKADETKQPSEKKAGKMEQATFGGGCFWCVEAVLQRVDGVEKVVSGYSGGRTKHPTYEQICTGTTGHAEVVQVTFDPEKVPYARLLEIFMKTHDPTTLNRQGNDIGDQYRSVIFTHNDQQARVAKEIKEKLDAAKVFDAPIVTVIEPLKVFYPAEGYHQDYYNRNPTQGYCQVVVRSKVEKLEKFFKQYMKAQ
jgi:peptide-methionine (S)-S-oxide reductase